MKRLIKGMFAATLFGVLGIAVLLGVLWLDHNRETDLPAPTGSLPVGRTTFVWNELFVWVWYPAAPRLASQTIEDYLPPAWRTAAEREYGVLNTKFLSRDLARVHANSLRDAELSPQEASYPVVLMPGGVDFTTLAEDLASHGYVVVSFDAPYRSSIVVFPDGRVITRAPQNNPELFSGPEQVQLATKLVQAGSADMRFLLDRLEGLNASDPSRRFLKRLDMQRIGAFGHSIRGATALQFCHDDPRCKACIDLDGIPFGSVIQEGLTQPAMFLLSDHRGESDTETREAEANFASLYSRLTRDRWQEIMIRGANHYMFSDDGVLRSPILMRVLRSVGLVKIDGRRQLAIAAHFIDAFFDAYLKDSPVSELKAQAEYPEVENLH